MQSHGNAEQERDEAEMVVGTSNVPLVRVAIANVHRLKAAGRSAHTKLFGLPFSGLLTLVVDVVALAALGISLAAAMSESVEPAGSLKLLGGLVSLYVLISAAVGSLLGDVSRYQARRGFVATANWLAAGAVTFGLLHAGDMLADTGAWKFLGIEVPLGAVVLLAARAAIVRVLGVSRIIAWFASRVAVVGKGQPAWAASAAAVLAQDRGDAVLAGVFDIAGDGTSQARLASRLQAAMPEAIILAVDWHDHEAVLAGAAMARSLPADLLVPASALPPGTQATHRLGDMPLVRLWCRPLGGWRGFAKRAEDLSIGLIGLIVAAPVMAVAALLVRLDSPGPVLIRQRRFGYGNRVILIWKFRTMHWEQSDLTGAQATVRNDPRVTRIGRFLRRTSFDELPQLINVLRGDMSLVGPRPHPVEMRVGDAYYHEAVAGYVARHRVKPGITGLAQINGCRGLVDSMEKAQLRLAYDLHYVDNWSLSLDLSILVRTTYRGFLSGGSF